MTKQLVVPLMLCTLSLNTWAKTEQEVYQEAQENNITVQDVKNIKTGTSVLLTGSLQKPAGQERYEFRDETGNLILGINDDVWELTEMQDGDNIQVIGVVNKETNQPPQIDVSFVMKMFE